MPPCSGASWCVSRARGPLQRWIGARRQVRGDSQAYASVEQRPVAEKEDPGVRCGVLGETRWALGLPTRRTYASRWERRSSCVVPRCGVLVLLCTVALLDHAEHGSRPADGHHRGRRHVDNHVKFTLVTSDEGCPHFFFPQKSWWTDEEVQLEPRTEALLPCRDARFGPQGRLLVLADACGGV